MYKRRESKRKKEEVDHLFPSIDCINPQVSPLEAGEDSGVNPMTNIHTQSWRANQNNFSSLKKKGKILYLRDDMYVCL